MRAVRVIDVHLGAWNGLLDAGFKGLGQVAHGRTLGVLGGLGKRARKTLLLWARLVECGPFNKGDFGDGREC